jgi:hypothetical protein
MTGGRLAGARAPWVTLLAVAGAAMLAPGMAGAEPAPGSATRVALFARQLQFTLPAGFVRVTDRANGTNVLIEYVPAGENVGNWTRMVTIQAYRGLGRSPAATAAIARQAFYPAACTIGPLYRDFGERVGGGGLKQTIVANGCASLPAGAYPKALKGAGEQDFIMIFRDEETVYTLNYAERGAPFAGKPPPRDPARAGEILSAQFGPVRLVPVR